MKSNDSRSQWTDNEEKTYIKLKNISQVYCSNSKEIVCHFKFYITLLFKTNQLMQVVCNQVFQKKHIQTNMT